MKAKIYSFLSGQYFPAFTIDDTPIDLNLQDKRYIMAFDQSSTSSGIVIGDEDGNPVLAMALIRDELDGNPEIYAYKFRRVVGRFLKCINVAVLIHENTFQGKYKQSDYALAIMKGGFKQIKRETELDFRIESLYPTQWMAKFMPNNPMKSRGKKDIKKMGLSKYWQLEYVDVEDTYDAFGIYWAFVNHFYSKPSDARKVYKSMERCHTHKITTHVIKELSLEGAVKRILTLPDVQRRADYEGFEVFEFNTQLSMEDNIRCLTSQGNKVYVGIIPEHLGVIPIWYKYNLSVSNIETLVVAGYRNIVKNF